MKKLLLIILLCFPMIGFGQCILGDYNNEYGGYTYRNGDKYEREFGSNDTSQGKVALTLYNGKIFKGLSQDGEFIGKKYRL